MNNTEMVTDIKKSNFKHYLSNAGKAVLVASIISLSSCSSDNTKKFNNESTIGSVVEVLKDNTLLDENLDIISLEYNDNSYSFDDACRGYKEARQNGDTYLCNVFLQILDKMVFISKLFDALGIDMSTLKSYNVDIEDGIANVTYTIEKSKVVPGNITVPYDETFKKRFELDGLAYNLSSNYINAKKGLLVIDQEKKTDNLDVDDHYLALLSFAAGKPKISKLFLCGYSFRVSRVDKETKDMLEKAGMIRKR